VMLVVFIFLQDWRATIIPMFAVPVSLVATFAVFPLFGFSVNTLSLFGLVLAIGLVVDDAIVVVEGIQHHIEEGLTPKEAARKAMQERFHVVPSTGVCEISSETISTSVIGESTVPQSEDHFQSQLCSCESPSWSWRLSSMSPWAGATLRRDRIMMKIPQKSPTTNGKSKRSRRGSLMITRIAFRIRSAMSA